MLPGAKDTRKLGENLTAGFFIDRTIRTLARVRRRGYLTPGERLVIRGALTILQRVLIGENWVEIKQALPSWIGHTNQPAQRQYILKLIEITNSLLEKRSVENKDIQLLEEFFTVYSRVLLDKTTSL